MAIVVGQTVRGENFWNRKIEVDNIWDALNSGSHILLTAPRRVGKTSIMYKVLDEPQDNTIVLYVDTESADSKNEFWYKLFNRLLEEEFLNTLKTKAKNLYENIKSINTRKLTLSGIEFEDGSLIDYHQSFKRLIYDIDTDIKLIIMVDEFAQTIENIIENEDEQNAISLLKEHRALRQDDKFSSKALFIYAGSIGLEGVVSTINSSKHINDLKNIKVYPLEYDDAMLFIEKLTSSVSLVISKESIKYILDKIEWLIPFYIQLIIDEIRIILRRTNKITITDDITNTSIENALEHRNYFEPWESKIRTIFKGGIYKFTKELLNKISCDNEIDTLDIENLSVKYNLEEDEKKDILRTLKYDGYINNDIDIKIYRFNSPILKLWWYKNVAN